MLEPSRSKIPQGKKDIEVYEKGKEASINFINELNKKGFLKKYITPEEDALIKKVLDRINSEGQSLAKLERLITSKNFNDFTNSVSHFGISVQDIMNYYSGLLTHQILDIFELFKKYLMTTLDKSVLSLTGNEPLGRLLWILEQKGINHEFDQFMDKDIRNSLGHGWYWFENNIFNYVIDPQLKRTKTKTLGELFIEMRRASLLTASFIDNAFERILEIKKQ